MIFDPERIILGGGLTDIGEPLRAGTKYWLDELTSAPGTDPRSRS